MRHNRNKARPSNPFASYQPEPDTEALIRATAQNRADANSIRTTLAEIAGIYSPKPGIIRTTVVVNVTRDYDEAY